MPYKLSRSKKIVPGDPAFGTRWATEEEKRAAGQALYELEMHHNRIILVPAPLQNFPSHKVRVQEQQNPAWYIRFVAGRWDRRGCQVKRSRVERALRRVAIVGIVRRNGYEVALLKILMPEPVHV